MSALARRIAKSCVYGDGGLSERGALWAPLPDDVCDDILASFERSIDEVLREHEKNKKTRSKKKKRKRS